MFQKRVNLLNVWQFQKLSHHPGISHFVSGRGGGVSKDEVGELNLSFKVNDLKENVIENRRRIAEAFGIDTAKLIFPSQTHSNRVKVFTSSSQESDLEDTDSIITNEKGVMISVMSADCVPILLYDPRSKSVAAVHSGWKGTVNKILTETVLALKETYGCHAKNLIAGIGPSICQDVYEVGPEVFEEVKSVYGNNEKVVMHKGRDDKAYLNLWEMNRLQLIQLGVPEESIEVAEMCTYQNSDDFFSARKSQNKAGRFAAGIMIKI